MSVIYYEDDADISALYGKTIAILGYGNLGRPLAQNLRDEGLQVLVGVRELGTEQHTNAVTDGFGVGLIEDVAQQAPIKLMMVPDEMMPSIYLERVLPHLRRGDTLIFASGYNIAFGYIEPPPFVDVGLLAPRCVPSAVRKRYLDKTGFHSLIAVGQDASGQVWRTVLALAKASGSLKAGAIEVTIEQETELDLFLQQGVLPFVLHLLMTSANLLIDKGYPAEAVIMDLYISGEFNEYVARAEDEGLLRALRQSTMAAQFGFFSRLERYKDLNLERVLAQTLKDIRDKSFADEWAKEYGDGYPRLKRLLRAQENIDLWQIEQDILNALKRKA